MGLLVSAVGWFELVGLLIGFVGIVVGLFLL